MTTSSKASSGNPVVLRLEDVSKNFGGLKAVDDVSLEIGKGEIVGLVGPNGSGKSTLFNLIAGFYKPDGGRIYLREQRIDGLRPDKIFAKGLVRTFQIPRLFAGMTVFENLMLPNRGQKGEQLRYAPFQNSWRSQELENASTSKNTALTLNISKVLRDSVTALSGGQMKLTELGRGMTGSPEIMLLDEPTAGVFPRLAVEIFERISKLRAQLGITFFIIEHRLDLLFDCVDRACVMHEGKIIMAGTRDQILNDSRVRDVYLGRPHISANDERRP